MSRKLLSFLAILLVGAAFAPAAVADSTVGVLFFVPQPGAGEFNVVNFTGPNAGFGPDTNYITSELDLTSLTLAVTEAGGTVVDFSSSYFTIDSDNVSLDGAVIAAFEGATAATLSGGFLESTITLNDGTVVNINPTFSASISNPNGLDGTEGDLIIATDATGGTGPSPTPEPESFVLAGTGLTALAGMRRRTLLAAARQYSNKLLGALAVVAVLLVVPASGHAQTVRLTTAASPSTGLAGFNNSTLTGSGFPTGAISPAATTVTFSTACGGAAVTTTNPTSVSTFVGTTDHVLFAIPASLTAGTYFLSVSGTSVSNVAFASTNCSQIAVTATTTTLAACVPTSSLAVTVGTNVNAYVPFGSWEGGSTGIEEVPLEGTGVARNFPTAYPVNSCAANSSTGEVICTENGTNVDLINGTTLTTLTSGADQTIGFTGGSCYDCGVGVNASNNTAVIAMGYSGLNSGSGVQVLNLGNNTFNTPVPLNNEVSEDISIDSGRNLILSPSESGYYNLLKIGTGNSITEYNSAYIGGTLDSAAEDCTTGIALSSDEFTDQIYITDLTQATFSGSTWSAPGQFVGVPTLNTGGNYYSAGTSGISSAPGTGHLAVVTGEFGGSSYSVLKLPSTSGSGTPTLADFAYVGSMPTTPDGNSFSAGLDPHTVTAYTSPNTGKSYAVFADDVFGYPDYLGVVDLACVLALPRTAGTNFVIGNASSCTSYVAVP